MRVFTVYTPPAANPEAAPLLLPEAFCWPAALFGPLWFLAQHLWLPALAVTLATVLAALASPWASLGLALLLGFHAQDIRRWALARQGWTPAGLVAAPDEASATQRLVDAAA